MKRYSLIFLGIVLVFIGCQRSDICTSGEPSTPRLVVKFFDANHPTRVKTVTNFNVKEINATDYYFSEPVNDTIAAIPLRTGHSSTTYRVVINQGDSLAPTSATLVDTLRFTYTAEEIYVSRACGFRDQFSNFNTTLDQTPDSTWIKNIRVPQPDTIKNEKTAHLYIYF